MTLRTPDPAYGATLLRIGMGLLFLGHVTLRITLVKLPNAEVYFQSIGLPVWLLYLVTVTEAICGLLLIGGLFVRIASLVALPILIGATICVHWQNGFFFSNAGGGWEYPVFWALTLVVQSIVGAGRYGLDSMKTAETKKP